MIQKLSVKSDAEEQRILQMSSIRTWRGGEQQVANLVLGMRKQGHKPLLVVAKNSALENFCKENRFDYKAIRFGNGFNLLAAFGIVRFCRQNNVGLVHMHCSSSHLLAVFAHLLGNKAKMVLHRRVIFPLKTNYLSRWKFNYPGIKKIICVSDAIKNVVSQGIDHPEKCVTIYSGIDLQKVTSVQTPKSIRDEYKIKEKYIVAIIAALTFEKNHQTFINAAKHILESRDDVHFLIVGEGNLRKEIESLIDKLNIKPYVTLTGFRNDIPNILQQIDVLLLPSTQEGLGSTILEAFTNEVSVVASNTGGIPEIVHNNETGYLCEPMNHEAFARATISLLDVEQVRSKIIAQAYKLVATKFSIENTVNETIKIYAEVMAND